MNIDTVENPYADRDLRQRELVPPEKLAACRALVIGVGAVGRQVALQLALMGITQLDLFDHDVVEVVNLATQGYYPSDVGCSKVLATGEVCRLLHPEINVVCHGQRFARSSLKLVSARGALAVFCCVDSIGVRQLVWESVVARASLFVDGRMSGEVIRVLASDQPPVDGYYPSTLFAAHEAQGGSCTAKGTIYTASIAAGLMLSQFTRWLRDLPVEKDQCLNLLTSELSVA